MRFDFVSINGSAVLRILVLAAFVAPGLLSSAQAVEKPVPPKPLDPALAKMAQMIGGVWSNDDPNFLVEFRYDWAFNQTAVRGIGILDKAGANETPVEATFGWDADKKTVYYLDQHGSERVYKGTARLDGDRVILEFETLIGPPAKWRSIGKFVDQDTYEFTIYADKDGKWSPAVEQKLKRKQPPADDSRQITEGVIDAPLDAVWNAFATKAGQEAWNVAHAEIDLQIGGKMLTHYDAKGEIGDANTIENVILAFEPRKMLSIKVGKPPENFPFKEAIKGVWHVLYFEEAGPNRTRVRVVGLGYSADEESQKLRAFFEKGNAYTLNKLQEHFVKK
ncbi:MAG TPA: SRPBCC domain-containing protein [Pirellulales bacterium]|nr:SRPBCC domain-containing protein [Pirellulales bacterium]